MAINLSANTKTTGPVSQEVFDPNIGFKSGLEGLARGIGQAGQVAGNLAQKIHTKNDNVSKQLAATNYNVTVTEMNSAYDNYNTVISEETSTEEQIVEAKARVDKYKDEFTYDKIDLKQDADESYYKKYMQQLTANRDALNLDLDTKAQTRRQKKAITVEIAKTSQQAKALAGVPSSEHAVEELDLIEKSHEEGHVFVDVSDRDFIDKDLYLNFSKTLDTTISKLIDPSFLPADGVTELLKIKEKLESLQDLGTPRSKAATTSALVKVNNSLKTLGVKGDNFRKVAETANAEAIVNNAEVALINIDATKNPVNGVLNPAAITPEVVTALTAVFPEHISDTLVKKQNSFIGSFILNTETASGRNYLAEATLHVLGGGSFAGLPAEAYQLELPYSKYATQKWDRSDIANDPDVIAMQQKLVEDEVNLIKKGIADGDFSVLTRIDPQYADSWKKLHLSQDPDEKAVQWDYLKRKTQAIRKDPNFKDLFSGVRAFGILPKTDVAFSRLQDEQKIHYLNQVADLNGAGVYEFINTLENSVVKSDKTIGAYMKLHIAGLSKQAIEAIGRGQSIMAGKTLEGEDKDGNIQYTNATSATSMVEEFKEKGLMTPLELQIIAANKAEDYQLADMLEKIQLSEIASFLNQNPSATVNEAYYDVIESQNPYVDALGRKILTENETIVTIGALNPSNPKHATISSQLSSQEVTREYTKHLQTVFAEALVDQEIGSTTVLKGLETRSKLQESYDMADEEYASLKKSADQSKQNIKKGSTVYDWETSSEITREEYLAKNQQKVDDAFEKRNQISRELDVLASSQPERYNRNQENLEFVKGLFNKQTRTGMSSADFSEIITLDGVEYVVPKLKEGKKWNTIKKPNGDPFMFPVNSVYDSVHRSLGSGESAFSSLIILAGPTLNL